jgi:hypothetical protein
MGDVGTIQPRELGRVARTENDVNCLPISTKRGTPLCPDGRCVGAIFKAFSNLMKIKQNFKSRQEGGVARWKASCLIKGRVLPGNFQVVT